MRREHHHLTGSGSAAALVSGSPPRRNVADCRATQTRQGTRAKGEQSCAGIEPWPTLERAQAEALSTAQVMGLGAMALAVLVIANDFTALSVALPAIEQDFDADVTTVQWMITGYALVFGVLIVTGGRLADMFGRRQIFFVGTAIFAAFSVIGGLATNVWMLLVSRGVMGVGGALMWPAILGMTYALLRRPAAPVRRRPHPGCCGIRQRRRAAARRRLTDTLSWRWIFFLNLPIAAFAVPVAWRVVRTTTGTRRASGSTTPACSRSRSGSSPCSWRSIGAPIWAGPAR